MRLKCPILMTFVIRVWYDISHVIHLSFHVIIPWFTSFSIIINVSGHIVSYFIYHSAVIYETHVLFIRYVTSHCVIDHDMPTHVGISCFIISHIALIVKRPWVWKELYKSNVSLLYHIISCYVIFPMVGLPNISYVIIFPM